MPARPNDPRRTAKLALIEQHYANFADALDWSPDRFRRLCAALQLTPYELGALVRLRPGDTEACLRRGSFPPPVELHLTIFEHALYPSSHPPIIPSL